MLYKVFLVEDEIVARGGIRDNVDWKSAGFEFCGEASDGEIALPLIEAAQPDVLITDIKMPFMDGLQLCKIIREHLPWIKIIILSGHDEFNYAIRNETADWSAMQAAADKPAVLTAGDGKTTNCDMVHLSTGGHRLAPGFQMRGFIAGTKAQPETQLIYVECKGAEAAPGSRLSVDYSYVTGEYNYYYPKTNKVNSTLEVDLDQVATDLKYPVAEPVQGLIQKPGAEITAINQVILTLTGVARNEAGLQFNWQTSNPGEYPSYVHIGNPPVIGEDGILYGLYESPDIVSVPITSAGATAEWTTEVAVPKDVKNFFIMLSVESKKQRLFVNYAIDVNGQ